MLDIVTRPLAKKDLKGIWRYTFEKWGDTQADGYLAEIEAGIARLKHNPRLGRSREHLRPGYRSLRVKQHIVYYLITPSAIRVVRVLHAQMDPELHL